MEWKSSLRRTQSLKSVHLSCDQPTWTNARLRDKTKSVSQLVARYQTTVERNASVEETLTTPSLLETTETHLEALMWRNYERERSRAKTKLARAQSLGNLQNSAVSIKTLKALFESKAATQSKTKSSFRAATFPSPYKAADITSAVNGGVEKVQSPTETPKTQIPADAPANDAKDDHMTQKVVNQTRMERRKTIGGIDFEKIAASQGGEYQTTSIKVCSVRSRQADHYLFYCAIKLGNDRVNALSTEEPPAEV